MDHLWKKRVFRAPDVPNETTLGVFFISIKRPRLEDDVAKKITE